jgi:hypothetical protein
VRNGRHLLAESVAVAPGASAEAVSQAFMDAADLAVASESAVLVQFE